MYDLYPEYNTMSFSMTWTPMNTFIYWTNMRDPGLGTELKNAKRM